MTQAALSFDSKPASKADAVAELFRSRPGIWISALELAQVGGLLSSRTRISELRHAPYHMAIVNKTDRVGGVTRSWYRWEQ